MTQSERPRRAPQLTLVGPKTPSDEALVRAHLDGDRAAFGALVQRHQRLVLALVRRYARTPEESADLVQQSFLRAFAAAGRVFPRMRLSEEGAFRARNTLASRFRKARPTLVESIGLTLGAPDG